MGRALVTIVSAQNLLSSDVNGRSDPYVVVHLASQPSCNSNGCSLHGTYCTCFVHQPPSSSHPSSSNSISPQPLPDDKNTTYSSSTSMNNSGDVNSTTNAAATNWYRPGKALWAKISSSPLLSRGVTSQSTPTTSPPLVLPPPSPSPPPATPTTAAIKPTPVDTSEWGHFAEILSTGGVVAQAASACNPPHCCRANTKWAWRTAEVRTHTRSTTLNPLWEEMLPALYFGTAGGVDCTFLCVYVKDRDSFNHDDDIGFAVIPITTFVKNAGPHWFPVGGTPRSQISITVRINLDPEDIVPRSVLRTPQMQPGNKVPYSVHHHLMAGLATSNKGQTFSPYKCYRIHLSHVPFTFGDVKHHWNTSYDKAKQIFASPIQGPVIRSAIYMQHASLYKQLYSVQGNLYNATDFMQMINYGVRERVPIIFTYVLLDTHMNFSETGASFFKDFLSKHAMHSNALEEVRYAGEFFVLARENGDYRLIIDNSSGTYAPLKEHLPLLENLFTANFPDLQVSALDWQDPLVSSLKKQIKQQQLDDAGIVSSVE
ncbi:C2 domain [Pelomyxa schiedti]|nr:C2 domain [Pelomyxa schiedti]